VTNKEAEAMSIIEDQKQQWREKASELLDAIDECLPQNQARHLMWWIAKEALYKLGVMNGDIEVITGDGDPDLSVCPNCGGPADNGHDRCYPPNVYHCTKCHEEEA